MLREGDETTSSLPPPFCRGNWRQLTIALGVSAATVLALALRSYYAGDTAPTNVAVAGGR